MTSVTGNNMTSKELKDKREASGLSQKQLAVLTGVKKNTIYDYESGVKIPESKIFVLKKVLNGSTPYFNETVKGEKPPLSKLNTIRAERKIQGLTWKELAEPLAISGEALRIAFSRGSVDPVYIKIVEERLGIGNESQKDDVKKSFEQLRFEDVISKKVFEDLKPYIDTFQKDQEVAHKQIQELVSLVKVMAANIGELKGQLEEMRSK